MQYLDLLTKPVKKSDQTFNDYDDGGGGGDVFHNHQVTKGENLLAKISMTVVPLVDKYFSGYCNFTSHLPPLGQYTYHVTLTPGEVTVNASFIGNNEIRECFMSNPVEYLKK